MTQTQAVTQAVSPTAAQTVAPAATASPSRVFADVSGTDKQLSFETGKLASLADGAVVGTIGDTQVMVSATAAKKPRKGADFFPLTVDIEERMYAAGKVPGSFFRREGRASESAILTCRLTDRPLRPCFPAGFRNEVHVVGLVMSADQVNSYDVVAINTASAALCISGIPFSGPIGAVRIAYTADGQWIPHPTFAEIAESTFEMVVAGKMVPAPDGSNAADGDVAIIMVEASGTEGAAVKYESGAQKVDEAVLADGLEQSKIWIKEAIALQRQLIVSAGAKPEMEYTVFSDTTAEVLEHVRQASGTRPFEAEQIQDRNTRSKSVEELVAELVASLPEGLVEEAEAESQVRSAVRSLAKEGVRRSIAEKGVRSDGRTPTDIRHLSAEVEVLSMVHGSGLFQRGETQVMTIATLASERMDQLIDTIDPVERKRYLHHYNFPPFSTGETGFMRGPKRREIGHGALAERALLPVVPSSEEFPYTIRLVSEVMSSNGSTSMASVCGSSLSLMDAGVPIAQPVAGIAMGLVYEGGQYVTLTDILGSEDACGDMDFKVAGTREYVTALQLDTKIEGIPAEVLVGALEQAKQARMAVLDVMSGALAEPRTDVKDNAPKVLTFEVPADKVGEIIGPKGKVIKGIQEETGAEVNVDDSDGTARVTIAATSRLVAEAAVAKVDLIVNPPMPEIGEVYEGTVVNIVPFGAFVNFLPGQDGLIHISKLGGKRRLEKVEEVLSLDEKLAVVVDEVKEGRISLSLASGGSGGARGGGRGADGDAGDGSVAGGSVAGDGSFDGDSGGARGDTSGDAGDASVAGDDDIASDDSRREVSFQQEFDRQMNQGGSE